MLERNTTFRQKDVIIINDVPVKRELELQDKFSSASNLNLLNSFRTGRVYSNNTLEVENFKGILPRDLATTYVDYTYFDSENIDHNFDYVQEIKTLNELKLVNVREENFFVEKDCENLVYNYIINHQYIRLDACHNTYVSKRLYDTIQALINEIILTQPKIVVVTGKWGLFFLTACTTLKQTQGTPRDRKPLGGIITYRSSLMQFAEYWKNTHPSLADCIIIPIYHTIHAVGMPDKIPVMELDLQKISYIYEQRKQQPVSYFFDSKEIIASTKKEEILSFLNAILISLDKGKTFLSVDIETMFSSIIDCIGLCIDPFKAISIPFAAVGVPNLWTLEDEVEISCKLREVLLHPNALHVGQNYNYDAQFLYKLYNLPVYAEHDTMVLHHVLYNYLPKDLAFLASIYGDNYTYWKDEIDATKETPETRWKYNAKDTAYTLEIAKNLLHVLEEEYPKLQEFYKFQQQALSPVLVKIMNGGVNIDTKRKEELFIFFSKLMETTEETIKGVLGEPFNIRSSTQKKKLFSDLLGMTLQVKKKTGSETCDSAAMLDYIEEYPLYRPLLVLLLEYASLKVFTTNFLGMQLDEDNRARTQYKVAGTSTYRLASTKNVWGKGGNLQNLPEKGKIDLKYALQTVEDEDIGLSELLLKETIVEGEIILPNVKKMFIPDIGKEIADADYSGADSMVVAWDSECKWLMDFFLTRTEKLYAYIASEHLQREITPYDKEYKEYKAVCHGCVTGEHEVLTKEGWVAIEKYKPSEELAVWDKNTKDIHFEYPSAFTTEYIEKDEKLFEIHGASYHQVTTLNHTFPYKSGKMIKECEAYKLPKTSQHPNSGYYVSGYVDLSEATVKLIAFLQSESKAVSYTKEGQIHCKITSLFHEKEIFILRLLHELSITYTKQKGAILFDFDIPDILVPSEQLLTLTKPTLALWLEEQFRWNRKYTSSLRSKTTSNKNLANWIQTVAHLCGKSCKVTEITNPDTRLLYKIAVSNKEFYKSEHGVKRLLTHEGTPVFCPTTSTGFFLVRYKGHVMITGNSNYGVGIPKIAAMLRIPIESAKFLQDFYFRLCPEIPRWHSRIKKEIHSKGYLTNIFGARSWFLNKNDPMLYNKAYAWKPQSSIGILVNKGIVNIDNKHPEIDVLLQVHDSAVAQYDISIAEQSRKNILDCMTIALPYSPSLTIPADIKVSRISYGDTKKIKEK